MKTIFFAPLLLLALCTVANAQTSSVIDGETSVLLDVDLLASAASLEFSGVSSDVGVSAEGAAIFGINPRDAAALPTTFTYTPGTLSPFSGTIEHLGSVFFNDDSVEVGNFTIGFDAGRASTTTSGFFVESTTGISAILFDVATPSNLVAGETNLDIDADLLVSAEFATFLTDNSLASSDLTGADVGDASVRGISAVPEPSSVFVVSLLGLLGLRRQRI